MLYGDDLLKIESIEVGGEVVGAKMGAEPVGGVVGAGTGMASVPKCLRRQSDVPSLGWKILGGRLASLQGN